MKKWILIAGVVVSLLAAFTLYAQPEGRITYELKVNMHRTLPAGREEMKGMVPEFNTHHDLLVFNSEESVYAPVEEEPDEQEIQDGGMHLRIRRPQATYYYNRDKGFRLTQREFFGKNYLIKDSTRIAPWKMLDEVRTIQGLACKSATYTDDKRKQKITAWYTDSIRPFLGPELFNTLPGTVLQVDINDGERVYTAVKIEFTQLKKNELAVPTKGVRVTEEEFAQVVSEAQKKMGGQGNVIIRTN